MAVKSTAVTGTGQRGSVVVGTVVDFDPAGGGGVTPVGDPTEVTGCVGWYDANDITTLWQVWNETTQVASNNDPVGAWTNKGSVTSAPAQSTGSKRPTYKTGIQGGLPAVYGDGSDHLFSVAELFHQSSAAFTVFVVAATELDEDAGAVWSNGGSSADRVTMYGDSKDAGGFLVGVLGDSSGNNFILGTYNYGQTWTYNMMRRDGMTLYGRQDGVDLISNPIDGDGIGQGTSNRLFAQHTDASIFQGWIGEVIVYDNSISDDDILAVEAYIADKWGI